MNSYVYYGMARVGMLSLIASTCHSFFHAWYVEFILDPTILHIVILSDNISRLPAGLP